MLNLLTSDQIRRADSYTIGHRPIQSIDLMESASIAFTKAFINNYPDKEKTIAVYCGTGNNGGDGLAIARLLSKRGYQVNVKIARFSKKSSSDFDGNLVRLLSEEIPFDEFKKVVEIKSENADIIIDALIGSGLNKPLEAAWLTLVEWLNSLGKPIVSVDIPTGFKSEGPISQYDVTIKSDLTISFQRPKINFLLPESAFCIKRFEIVDIGLDEAFIQSIDSPYKLLTNSDISLCLKKRKPFSHKGTYGHALIIAGTTQTMGAALLCSEACLNTGAGLTTACIPSEGLIALNIRVPEVMAALRYNSMLPADILWDKYNAVAIGPGLGTTAESKQILTGTLNNFKHPVVIDADAINLISLNPGLILYVPKLSVFTPHVKEFDRLFDAHITWWDRLETGIKKARELECVIILKNRYTIIFTPDGKCIFNPTGTPAMATGGTGDVLTGMIVSFIAQGYKPEEAAILAVYLHGKAGEELVAKDGVAIVTAGKLAKSFPKALYTD